MNLRQRLRNLGGSLTFRAIAGLGLSLLLLILIGGAILYIVYQRALTAHFYREGEILVRTLAHSARLGVFSENPEELRPLFESLLQNGDIISVGAHNLEGELIFRLNAHGLLEGAAIPPPALLTDPVGGKIIAAAGGQYVDFWAPVLADPEPFLEEELYLADRLSASSERPIGLVGVRISTAPIKRWLRLIHGAGTIAATLFLLASLGISFLVIRAMHRPLSELLVRLRREGKAPGLEKDVDLLSNTYNHLLHQLNASFHQVERLNLELEEKVRERTGELSASNRELTATIAELRETQAQLIQSEKMAAMGQLVAGLAHEINNATNIVLNAVQMLNRRLRQEQDLPAGSGSSEVFSLLKMMEEGGLRTARIVKDLMIFARPAAVDNCRLLLLNQGLGSTISLLEYHFTAEGMELLVELDPHQPYLHGNGDELNQVWLNLILNAIQAVDGTGMVKIATSHDEERVYVTVSDNGPGIDPAIRADIFNPFFTTKRPGKGTGLGLTVSYRIINNHGGTIELLDSPEGGALFQVTLPRTGEPPAANNISGHQSRQPQT